MVAEPENGLFPAALRARARRSALAVFIEPYGRGHRALSIAGRGGQVSSASQRLTTTSRRVRFARAGNHLGRDVSVTRYRRPGVWPCSSA